MDERLLQLKQMKKNCRRLMARAGRGWKVMAWVCFVFLLLTAGMTLFVRFGHLPFVQMIDLKMWEPVKAAIGLNMDFGFVRQLIGCYGMIAALGFAVLWLAFAALGLRAAAKVKKSEDYLDYRTLWLTLKTEKEEK